MHGFEDLFVASSSTFPTSSQANSTFMLVALAVRLADQLAGDLRDGGGTPARSAPVAAAPAPR